jgi:hypothetical protein
MRAIPAFALCIPLAVASTVSTAHDGAGQQASNPAATRTIVIYRCTDAAGRVTIQNDVACPKGTKQQRQAIDVPPPMPAYVPREERMPAVVAAERADEAATITAEVKTPASMDMPVIAETQALANDASAAPAIPGPPPALYACRTWDERDFLTEDATPAERCAPLQVVAADGTTRKDAAACEKVKDQCEAVPAEALCTAWQRRVDEAEFRWKFAGAKQDDERRHDYELLKAKLAQSDCAGNQNP